MDAKTYRPPTFDRGWRWWDRLVETAGLVFSLPALPMAGVYRCVGRLRQRDRLAQVRDEYERATHEMGLASRRPADFLAVYFKRLHEIRRCYLSTNWHSLEEAEAGYRLMKAAEAALLAEAQALLRQQQRQEKKYK